MKKVTFPHLGNLYIGMEALIESLGLEPVSPPPTNKRTLEIGSRYVDDEACLPLKITVGNIMEAEDLGAEGVLMGGGKGPCRFGYYGEVQKDIIGSLGSKLEFIIFEPNVKDVLAKIKYLTGGFPLKKLLRGFQMALKKIEALDSFDKHIIRIRPWEKEKGQMNVIERKFYRQMRKAASFQTVNKVYKEALRELEEARGGAEEIIKIALVGEFYMILERYANANLERIINDMGAKVVRSVCLSDWIKTNLLGLNSNKRILKMARPYIKTLVGGHGRETVGEAVLSFQEGIDGIIHLAPLTCMPEIIAESVLQDLSRRFNMPVLFLFLDEHSGEVGLRTRVEAFIDTLKFRKERKKHFEQERLYRG